MPDVAERMDAIAASFKEKGIALNFISALARQNLTDILWKAQHELVELPEISEESSLPIYRPESREAAFELKHTSEGWRLTGGAIERAAAMTYWEYFESVRRFHRILESMGIEDAMQEAGVHEGDRVLIGKHELVWSDNWED